MRRLLDSILISFIALFITLGVGVKAYAGADTEAVVYAVLLDGISITDVDGNVKILDKDLEGILTQSFVTGVMATSPLFTAADITVTTPNGVYEQADESHDFFIGVSDASKAQGLCDALGKLSYCFKVEYAEQLAIPMVSDETDEVVPSDPYFANQWQHDPTETWGVDTELAWDFNQGTPDVKLGHVDFGWHYQNCPVEWRYEGTQIYRVMSGSDSPQSYNNDHGFETGSVFFATGNNSSYVAGMNWGSPFATKDITFRVFGVALPYLDWVWDQSKIENAFSDLRNHFHGDHSVTSMSWDSPLDHAGTRNRILELYLNNSAIYAARGNEDWQAMLGLYPAEYSDDDFVETVGGYTQSGAPYGVRDSYVRVVAPANHMTVIDANNNVITNEAGTSFASPTAAGVASLVWSANPSLEVDDVRWILRETTNESMLGQAPNFSQGDHSNYNLGRGYGRVNADRAVAWASLYPIYHERVNEYGGWTSTSITVSNARKEFGSEYEGSATRWEWTKTFNPPSYVSDDFLVWARPANSLHPNAAAVHPNTDETTNYGEPFFKIEKLPSGQLKATFWQWQYGGSQNPKYPTDGYWQTGGGLNLQYTILDKKIDGEHHVQGLQRLFGDLDVTANAELHFNGLTHIYAGSFDGDNQHQIHIYGDADYDDNVVLHNDVYLHDGITLQIDNGAEVVSDPPAAGYTFRNDDFSQVLPTGDISSNFTLYPAPDPLNPIVVDRNIHVVNSACLTIMPGTTIYFTGNGGLTFDDDARLQIKSTSMANPVRMAANGAQQWAGLRFNGVDGDAVNQKVRYLIISGAVTALDLRSTTGDFDMEGISISNCTTGISLDDCYGFSMNKFIESGISVNSDITNCVTGITSNSPGSEHWFEEMLVSDCVNGIFFSDPGTTTMHYSLRKMEVRDIDEIGVELNSTGLVVLQDLDIHDCGITGLKLYQVESVLFNGTIDDPNEVYHCGSDATTYDPAVSIYGDTHIAWIEPLVIRENQMGGLLLNAGVDFHGDSYDGPVSIGNNQRNTSYNTYEFIVGPLCMVTFENSNFNVFNDERTWGATLPTLMQVMTTSETMKASGTWWGSEPQTSTDVLDHFYGSTSYVNLGILASLPHVGDGNFYPGLPGDNADLDDISELVNNAYEMLGYPDGEPTDVNGAVEIFTGLMEDGFPAGVSGLSRALRIQGYSTAQILDLIAAHVNEDYPAVVKAYEMLQGDMLLRDGELENAIGAYNLVANETEDEEQEILALINVAEIERLQMLVDDGSGKRSLSAEERDAVIQGCEDEIRELNARLFKLQKTASNDAQLPEKFQLGEAYPNPFNPSVTIPFALPERSTVQISVYNVVGRQVATLVDGNRSAGYHRVVWNGKSDANLPVSSGIYFVRMKSGGFVATRKAIMMK